MESGNDILGDYETQKVLDEEYEQLLDDRKQLRNVVFPNGDNNWPLPVNLRRVIQNAQQIFGIDRSKASDLKIIEVVHGYKTCVQK